CGWGSPFRPALPPGRPPHPCPPSRVGELRVNCGWGRSSRGSPSPPRTPPPGSIPTFPHPGWGEMGGGLPGGADGWTGLPHPHPPFVLVDGPHTRLSFWEPATPVRRGTPRHTAGTTLLGPADGRA